MFPENEAGPTPTRAELIHLINIWLDLEKTIMDEVGPNATDLRGALEQGRASGVALAATDLLELLGYSDQDDDHDDDRDLLVALQKRSYRAQKSFGMLILDGMAGIREHLEGFIRA